jgi:hypothetical protein
MGDTILDLSDALTQLAYPAPAEIPVPYTYTFETENGTPQAALYVTPDDYIIITAYCSVANQTLYVSARFLQPDGYCLPMQQALALPSNGSAVTVQLRMNLGYLISVTLNIVSVGTTFQRGQIFVSGNLQRPSSVVPLSTVNLFNGYFLPLGQPGWPGPWFEPAVGGKGCMRVINGTLPSLGQNIVETVPTGRRWVLRSFAFHISCSATVATRTASFYVLAGTSAIAYVPFSLNATASQTVLYMLNLGQGSEIQNTPILLDTVPVTLLDLLPTWTLNTYVNNLQANDQVSAPTYLVEEWFNL